MASFALGSFSLFSLRVSIFLVACWLVCGVNVAEHRVKPEADADKYAHVEKLAENLGHTAGALKEDIAAAKAQGDETLQTNKGLEEMVAKFFGSEDNVVGLKAMDQQAHKLRGRLQQEQQGMTDALGHVIADFQSAPHDSVFHAKNVPDYDPKKADRTGLKVDKAKQMDVAAWRFNVVEGGNRGNHEEGKDKGVVEQGKHDVASMPENGADDTNGAKGHEGDEAEESEKRK